MSTFTAEEQVQKAWAAGTYMKLQELNVGPRNTALKKYFGPKSALSHDMKVALVDRAFREREAMNWGLMNLEGIRLTRIVSWMGSKLTPKMVTDYLLKNKHFNTGVLEVATGYKHPTVSLSRESRETIVLHANKEFFTEELFTRLFEQADELVISQTVVADKAKEFYGMAPETPVSWVRKMLGID